MAKYILNYGEDPLYQIGSGYVPEHMRSCLENYFFRGWEPGGFMTAVLSGDLFLAVQRADSINKTELANIALWVLNNAPRGSIGSIKAIEDWCADADRGRTTWATATEKKFMWDTLAETE